MRGVAFRCETLSSHFVCPSCTRKIAKYNSFDGFSRPFRSGDSLSRRKAFSTQTRVSVPKQRLARSKWAPPRFIPSQARSIAQQTVAREAPGVAIGDAGGVFRTSGGQITFHRGRSDDSTAESKHDAVMRTLAQMQPDCVMEAFLDPQNYDILFRSLPATTFAEAFRLLSPRYFTDDYKKCHRYFHPIVADARLYKPLRAVCDEFFANISTIAYKRRHAGHSLGLYEYAHLLDCARAMGHGYMAGEVWRDISRRGLTPNLECFNYYMETKAWDRAYFTNEKFNLRPTPFVKDKRSRPFRNPSFMGYKTGPGGVKDEVSELFNLMTEQGIQGDEHTFVNVMTATAREGHMRGVKDILKAVWDIDVDLLTSTEDERSHPQVRTYPPTSPLYPTERLLHAVAHIFGTNHDFPGGLQTVDFISRKYNIPIPEHVWMEILEWAYTLSVKRRGHDAYEQNPGKISPDAVLSIFNTITSEPYNIEPTMSMYHIMVKVSYNDKSIKEILKYMRAGLSLFTKTLETRDNKAFGLSILLPAFEEAQRQQHTQQIFNPFLKDYYTLCREYSLAQLQCACDSALLERWVRLLLHGARHWKEIHRVDWQRRVIPNMIEEWKEFFPRHVYYQMNQGTVSFHEDEIPGKIRRNAEDKFDVGIREKGEFVRPIEEVYRGLRLARAYQAKLAETRHMSASSSDGGPEKGGD